MNDAEFFAGDQFEAGPLFTDETFAEIGDQAETYLCGLMITQEILGEEARAHLAVTAIQTAGAVARENIQAIAEAGDACDPARQVTDTSFADFVECQFGEAPARQLRWLHGE